MSGAILAEPLADFAAFCGLLRDELGCDLRECAPSTRLVEDLGWDSLAFFELLGLLDRHGLEPPDELVAAGLATLADVHHYFTASPAGSRSGAGGGGAAPTLHVPTHGDFDYLFQLHSAGDHLVRYRLRGQTPGPDSFHRLLWEGVVAQFVLRADTGDRVGLVSCFGADLRNRHAHLGVVGEPTWCSRGLVVAGAWRFIDYLFAQFDLRKLYAEVLDTNFGRVASGAGRLFEVEGRLTGHEYLDGCYHDLYVLALDRARWQEQRDRIHFRPGAE